jgi:hypothetical protein
MKRWAMLPKVKEKKRKKGKRKEKCSFVLLRFYVDGA